VAGISGALIGKADYLETRAELCEETALKLLKMASKDKTRARYLRAVEQRAAADEAAAMARAPEARAIEAEEEDR
jgi:hypothetical protein